MVSVLHIWNTAGVASTIAKYQRKILGWDTWVITRKKYDPYGLTIYGQACECGRVMFYLYTIFKSVRYDVIHIHSRDEFLRILNTPRRVGLYKCLVIHYHGSEIRNKWSARREYWSKADIIMVSTPDLLRDAPRNAFYIPNPVDTELFRPLHMKRKNKALVIVKGGRSHMWKYIKPIADKYSRRYGLTYDVIFVDKNPIPYTKLPLILNQYEYFIDLHHGYNRNEALLPFLSKTGLEALACKTKVIRWDGEIITKLPDKHLPENVVRRIKKVYEDFCSI